MKEVNKPARVQSRYEKLRDILLSVNGVHCQTFETPDFNHELINKSRVEAWQVGGRIIMVQVWPERLGESRNTDSVEIYPIAQGFYTWEETAKLLKLIEDGGQYYVKPE